MAKEIKVKASLVDNLSAPAKKAVDKTNKQMTALQKGTAMARSSFVSLGSAIVPAMGVGVVVKFTKTVLDSYDKQIKAETELSRALGYRSDLLLKQASALQKVTTFGDEATIAAQATMAAFIKDDQVIAQLIPLVQDLATSKGMDLNSAAEMVTKSIAGEVNALGRLGISLGGAKTQGEKVIAVTKGLTAGFKGSSEAAARAGMGPIQQFQSALGDLGEEVGKSVLPMFVSLADNWTRFLNDRGNTKQVEAHFKAVAESAHMLAIEEFNAHEARTKMMKTEVKRLEGMQSLNKFQQQSLSANKSMLVDMEQRQKQLLQTVSQAREAGIKKSQEDAAAKEKEKADAIALDRTNKKIAADEAAREEERKERIKQMQDFRESATQRELAQKARLAAVDEWQREQDTRMLRERLEAERAQMVAKDEISLALMGQTERELELAHRAHQERRKILGESKEAEQLYANEVAEIKKAAYEREIADREAMVQAQIAQNNMMADSFVNMSAIIQNISGKNKGLMAAEAFARAGMGFANAMALPFPANLGAFANATAQFGIMKQAMSTKAAQGADFVTNGPQLMMVGENAGGRERVTVTPQGSPNVRGGGGDGIVFNFYGTTDKAAVRSSVAQLAQLGRDMRDGRRRGYVG